MTELFGIPLPALLGQLLLGLVNGSFYAMLSLRLAVIFGMLNIINFAHGALYMMGAFFAWMGLEYLGLNYCVMLGLAPLLVGLLGIVIERTMLQWLYKLDHLYGLLLTFGITLVIEGVFRSFYGVSGQPYSVPEQLQGATNLGFMILPNYRAWVVVASLVVCFAVWALIEKTSLGAKLRAGTENPKLVQAFGINVPAMVTLTYAGGVALAAFAGVLAAPILQVSALMGSNLIIVVFAVVVIGGMGSILGSILTGLGLGLVEGLTKVFYPEASNTVVFVVMAFVLLVLCYVLFACAFNLLIGFTGLLSFGHAAFLGTAGYVCGHALKVWGLPTPVGLVVGALAAAGVGLVFGLLAIRRSGIYFSMITLALAQMLYFFFLQAPFTGGEDGLQSVPRGSFLGLNLENDLTLFYVVLGLFVAAFWLIYRIVHSPFGQVLTSIRENEARATSLGYDTAHFKLLAFVLSAALAGLAGSTKTLVLGFATLTDAIWTTSGLVILMTLVGGMGTLVGPMVGALVIIALENKIGDA